MKYKKMILGVLLCIALCRPVCATVIEREDSMDASRQVTEADSGRLYWWPVAGLALAGGGFLTFGMILRRKHDEEENQ